jgi:hypothetical protein
MEHPPSMTELYELVFEGLSRDSAETLTQEITGKAIILPADNHALDLALSPVALSGARKLEEPHLRVLHYDGATFDIERNFVGFGDADPLLCDALHLYANQLANLLDSPVYFARLDPARDEETRLFTGTVTGPFARSVSMK